MNTINEFIDLAKNHIILDEYISSVINELFPNNKYEIILNDEKNNKLICNYLNKQKFYWCGVNCEILYIEYDNNYPEYYYYKLKINNLIFNTSLICKNYFELDNDFLLIQFLSEKVVWQALRIKKHQFKDIIKFDCESMNDYIDIYDCLDESWLKENFDLLNIYNFNWALNKLINTNFFDKHFDSFNEGQLHNILKSQKLQEWFIKKYIDKFNKGQLELILIHQHISDELKKELEILYKLC